MADTTTAEAAEAAAEEKPAKGGSQPRQEKKTEAQRLLEERVKEAVHLAGCPAPEGRIESYEATGPQGVYKVVRCGECGGQRTTRLRGADDGGNDEVIER